MRIHSRIANHEYRFYSVVIRPDSPEYREHSVVIRADTRECKPLVNMHHPTSYPTSAGTIMLRRPPTRMPASASGQGLTLVYVRAQCEQLQNPLMI